MPAAADDGMIRADHIYADFLERQLAHLLAFALVFLLVTIESRLPAGGLGPAGEKTQVRRIPVTGHESFQVALVPGDYLIVEYFSNRVLARGCLGLERRQGNEQTRANRCGSDHEPTPE